LKLTIVISLAPNDQLAKAIIAFTKSTIAVDGLEQTSVFAISRVQGGTIPGIQRLSHPPPVGEG
jgi:hypothetical protein